MKNELRCVWITVGFFSIMELHTKKGELFLIDDEDYDLVKDTVWRADKDGYLRGWHKTLKKNVSIHRLIMGVLDCRRPLVDHKNGDVSDNRRFNLRLCTDSENNKNRVGFGKSKHLGVSVINVKTEESFKIRYTAKIRTPNGRIYLGSFKNEIDAANAYNEAAIKYHGEFARLNTFD